MAFRSPIELPVDHTVRFLQGALPRPPADVLEVGCGSGAVAERLTRAGYRVTGIDTEPESVEAARQRGVGAIEADLLTFQAGPFDAVVFVRSLHHVARVAAATERAHALLRPGGLVVAEEFAIERMDLETARWFYELLSLLEAAGIVDPDPDGGPLVASQLDRWYAEHEARGPVHDSEEMLIALGSRFGLDRIESAPYLYRYVCERARPTPEGTRVANWVHELESMRVAQTTLRAVGLRVVGRRL